MLSAAAVARVMSAEMGGAESGLADLLARGTTFRALLAMALTALPVKMVRRQSQAAVRV